MLEHVRAVNEAKDLVPEGQIADIRDHQARAGHSELPAQFENMFGMAVREDSCVGESMLPTANIKDRFTILNVKGTVPPLIQHTIGFFRPTGARTPHADPYRYQPPSRPEHAPRIPAQPSGPTHRLHGRQDVLLVRIACR